MNFEDSLKIGANVYDIGYAEVGGKYYSLNDDGTLNLSDNTNEALKSGFDEEGNPLTPEAFIFIDFGKCVILPNTKASIITLADGQNTHMCTKYTLRSIKLNTHSSRKKETRCI